MQQVNSEKSEDFYCNIFDEVCKGSSSFDYKGNLLFIKHPTISDFVYIQREVNREKARLVSKGIDSFEGIIASLKESGEWDFEVEDRIQDIGQEIADIESFIKTQFIKAIVSREKGKIKKLNTELDILAEKMAEFMPRNTAESMAESRVNGDFLFKSLFRDEDCAELAFSEDEVDYMDSKERDDLFKSYNDFRLSYSEILLQKVVLRDFFQPYRSHCKDAFGFYGKPVSKLSQNQLNILYYSEIFVSVFKNHSDKIPEDIRYDPVDILAHVEGVAYQDQMTEKSASKVEDSGANFVMSAKFGAKEGDYRKAGVRGKIINPMNVLKKGEKLDMEGTMKAFAKEAGIIK